MQIALIETHIAYHPDGVEPSAYTRTPLPGKGYLIRGRREVVGQIVAFANLHSGRQIARVIDEAHAATLQHQAAE
ncbi:MAG TPA: hypothetical protein VLB83_04480 [Candidatus Paceibacterota bacterium]|nr:hypothetical protein [Candidatus Paceibacterota bacterium]